MERTRVGLAIRFLLPYVIFSTVSCAILGPLLFSDGFVFAPDMVFVPNMPEPNFQTSSFLFYWLIYVLQSVVSVAFMQKILLFSIFFLAGRGMFLLVRRTAGELTLADSKIMIPACLAGLFYAANPFVYSRLMMGQFAVLLGYALLPFFATALIDFYRKTDWCRALVLLLTILIISIVSVHTLGPMVILFLGITFVAIWRTRHQWHTWKHPIAYMAGVTVLCVVASGYWLWPLIIGSSGIAQQIAGFNEVDVAAFASVGGVATLLRLGGFWADSQTLYIIPEDVFGWWWLPMLVLAPMLLFGIYRLWKASRVIAVILLMVSISSLLIASGVLQTELAGMLPPFKGFREPHKFLALLAFCYALLLAVASTFLVSQFRRRGYILVTITTVAITCFTPLLWWGVGGQLHACNYPNDWPQLRQKVQQAEGKTLFLPWHLYMTFSFSGSIIANPAERYFGEKAIISQNPDIKGLVSKDPMQQKITRLLQARPADFAAQLAEYNVQYIVVMKEYDYRNYDFLQAQQQFVFIKHSNSYDVYKNEGYK